MPRTVQRTRSPARLAKALKSNRSNSSEITPAGSSSQDSLILCNVSPYRLDLRWTRRSPGGPCSRKRLPARAPPPADRSVPTNARRCAPVPRHAPRWWSRRSARARVHPETRENCGVPLTTIKIERWWKLSRELMRASSMGLPPWDSPLLQKQPAGPRRPCPRKIPGPAPAPFESAHLAAPTP